jgi:hypothetical protein
MQSEEGSNERRRGTGEMDGWKKEIKDGRLTSLFPCVVPSVDRGHERFEFDGGMIGRTWWGENDTFDQRAEGRRARLDE